MAWVVILVIDIIFCIGVIVGGAVGLVVATQEVLYSTLLDPLADIQYKRAKRIRGDEFRATEESFRLTFRRLTLVFFGLVSAVGVAGLMQASLGP